SRQLKLSFNKSGQSWFSASKTAFFAANPRAKKQRPRHGNDHFGIPFLPGEQPRRTCKALHRAARLLAAVLRQGVQPLPAGTALTMTRLRYAILDDYLNLTLTLADWSKISDRVDVTVFNQPFSSSEAAGVALGDFEIICAMRERTPFPRPLFAALPKLKLLITSGMRNAAID